MDIVKFTSGQIIAKKNDKVKYWYIVQEGTVILKIDDTQLKLGKNSIVGILEKDMYLCDYIAGEDITLAAFVCQSCEDLKKVLTGQEKIRELFLRSAIEQRHNLLYLYSELFNKVRQFHAFVQSAYNDYKTLCAKYRIEEHTFNKMENFKPLHMNHKAENWEVSNSLALVKNYFREYIQLMEKDESLTIGAIMETSAQMRRFALGIGELQGYLGYNKDILICENQMDIFGLYFDLAIDMKAKKYEIDIVQEKINLITAFAEKLNVYNPRMITRKAGEFKNYDYEGNFTVDENGNPIQPRREIDIFTEDCMGHILEYAGYSDDEIEVISSRINDYHNLPDMLSTDKEAYALRKKITAEFYDIYYRVFMRAVNDEASLTTVLEMFLNFGFMDVSYISEEQAKALYDLCAHLDICSSDNVYTIYRWLKCVYNGEKEPCKNDFDMSYIGYLADLRKRGDITDEEMNQRKDDRAGMVEFEIKNMFATVNKVTYGKVTTFCPVLCENDLINSIEKMLVTADKIENSINEVRKLDYSAFYREVVFSDVDKGINNERVMKEILPDIILMPNAGTRGMMWQEISGSRTDTAARFMMPVFTAVDLDDMILEMIGRYRWEICRRIQGIHWNDIRESSLTAEYCEFIQFYRKNSELSTEAKEKIKGNLVKAKNNYREVFVRDYISWIKYESNGSFRLNKVSRDILNRYCPFVKEIRNELKTNPIYQTSITKFEAENIKKLQRYTGLYNKYVKAGGKNSAEIKETIAFYEM